MILNCVKSKYQDSGLRSHGLLSPRQTLFQAELYLGIRVGGLEPPTHGPKPRMLPLTPHPVLLTKLTPTYYHELHDDS